MSEIRNKLNITGVQISEYRNGIPLQGWESVSNALDLYSKGISRLSSATRNDLLRNAAQKGGAEGMFLVLNAQGDRSSFVQEMLEEAKAEVESRGSWQRHYDYDGQGVFHKTTVKIKRLADLKDGYLLGLNAAYVGQEVEDNLAQTLGIEQGLQWKSVNVTLTPDVDQFRIDFAQVVDRLEPIVADLAQSRGRERIAGLDVASYFMSTNEWRIPARDFVLGLKDGVVVTLNLGSVKNRFEYRNGKIITDNWRQEESILLGPLDTDYDDETKLVSPSLVISMDRFSEARYNRLPAVDPKMKTTMNVLADRTAASFQPEVQ